MVMCDCNCCHTHSGARARTVRRFPPPLPAHVRHEAARLAGLVFRWPAGRDTFANQRALVPKRLRHRVTIPVCHSCFRNITSSACTVSMCLLRRNIVCLACYCQLITNGSCHARIKWCRVSAMTRCVYAPRRTSYNFRASD
jgi:hypothetical protein